MDDMTTTGDAPAAMPEQAAPPPGPEPTADCLGGAPPGCTPEEMAGASTPGPAGSAMADTPQPPALPPGVEMIWPDDIEVHPLADMLPMASATDDAQLEQSIACNGQRLPAVRFEGKLLDGRRRRRACRKLGNPLLITDLIDRDPLTYVLDANVLQRPLSPSQKGAVAAKLKPVWAEYVNAQRIERLRRTLADRDTNQCAPPVGHTPSDARERGHDTDRILARLCGISHTYVAYASRLEQEAPGLFEQVWRGELSLKKAVAQLTGEDDAEYKRMSRSVRQVVNATLRALESRPALMAEYLAWQEQFQQRLADPE